MYDVRGPHCKQQHPRNEQAGAKIFSYQHLAWSRPHDHKLRKYLSLKLDFEYLKLYWTHCFNNL